MQYRKNGLFIKMQTTIYWSNGEIVQKKDIRDICRTLTQKIKKSPNISPQMVTIRMTLLSQA